MYVYITLPKYMYDFVYVVKVLYVIAFVFVFMLGFIDMVSFVSGRYLPYVFVVHMVMSIALQ